MWIQEGHNWHFGKNEVLLLIENITIKNTPGTQIKILTILWQKYDLKKTMKNKRNLSIKCFLMRNFKNADTTFLHSHDEILTYLMATFIQWKSRKYDKIEPCINPFNIKQYYMH